MDSSVVAALLIKAIGQQLVCVHVNHGLLRKGEPEQVIEVFRNQMIVSLISWQALRIQKRREKLLGENSLKYLLKKQESLIELSS